MTRIRQITPGGAGIGFLVIAVFRLVLHFVVGEWKDGDAHAIANDTVAKAAEKESHASRTQVSVSEPIIAGQYLRISVQVSHSLNISHESVSLRSVKGMRTEHLGCHAPYLGIDVPTVGIVLDKTGAVGIRARNEAFYGKQGRSLAIGKFHRVGPDKVNLCGGFVVVEPLRPSLGFVLQEDIVLNRGFGSLGGIHLAVYLVGLGDVIQSARPAHFVEAVVGGAHWRSGSFFHSVTKTHGSVGERHGFHLDNGFFG
mmetsp:Transcript_44732/g.52421  ORF Transcript_44732/g.52421 Transcript_44732/m.52421 type:complete len:255 (-) Transcript_44732:316-1080(-)